MWLPCVPWQGCEPGSPLGLRASVLLLWFRPVRYLASVHWVTPPCTPLAVLAWELLWTLFPRLDGSVYPLWYNFVPSACCALVVCPDLLCTLGLVCVRRVPPAVQKGDPAQPCFARCCMLPWVCHLPPPHSGGWTLTAAPACMGTLWLGTLVWFSGPLAVRVCL